MSTVYAFPTPPPSAPLSKQKKRGSLNPDAKGECRSICESGGPTSTMPIKSIGGTPLTPLVRADEMMALQKMSDRYREADAVRSSLAGLDVSTAVADARDALLGIPEDLLGNTSRKSLWASFTHNDRLRGVGVLLVAIAASGLLVEALLG
jgi:hypothetical protein